MSETEKTGGPAFPISGDTGEGNTFVIQGMSILDYFAAEAMNGLCQDEDGFVSYSRLAKDSYDIAEAMILERKKRCKMN